MEARWFLACRGASSSPAQSDNTHTHTSSSQSIKTTQFNTQTLYLTRKHISVKSTQPNPFMASPSLHVMSHKGPLLQEADIAMYTLVSPDNQDFLRTIADSTVLEITTKPYAARPSLRTPPCKINCRRQPHHWHETSSNTS